MEAARATAEDEARRLNEIQKRITASETGRRRAENERLQLEADVQLREQKEQERFKEARQRLSEEQRKIDELQRRAEEDEVRLEELRALRQKIERDAQLRLETEEQLLGEIEEIAAREKRLKEIEDRPDLRQAS